MLAVVTAPSINDDTAPDLRRSSLLYGLAALWLLLWTMVATVESARYLHGPTGPTWRVFVTILIEPAVVGIWLAWVIATRKFESPAIDRPRVWFRYHLRALPWLALAAVPIVWGLRWGFYWLIDMNFGGPPIHLMIPFEGLKVALFYGLWLALMFGLLTLAKQREDSERLLGVQKALVEAQLAQLQAQLRPHFLFNALNTVSSLMQTDPARADRVLSELGDLLRANLGTTRRDLRSAARGNQGSAEVHRHHAGAIRRARSRNVERRRRRARRAVAIDAPAAAARERVQARCRAQHQPGRHQRCGRTQRQLVAGEDP